MEATSVLELNSFFPSELKITSVNNEEDKITIKLRSKSQTYKCPVCGKELTEHHATNIRKAQDLPIFGKSVSLIITSYDYRCDNEDCEIRTVTETFDGFLLPYQRMTERCKYFICMLALETSCESCAQICNAMNLKISGDTVIRMLISEYKKQPEIQCGSTVGVDDFAYKKRNTYGTIVVDEKTHNTVAILDGRDSDTLKEWLSKNKHIKTVTRDRAGAYASAIREMLPDAVQIADRFHLHQNLLEVIRNVINSRIPVNVKIPIEIDTETESEKTTQSYNSDKAESGKKISKK